MRTRSFVAIWLACAALVPALAGAVVVPDDFATIQAAIDSLPDFLPGGGLVQVRPGTYPEALRVEGKSLRIEGLGGRPVIAPGPTAKGLVARDRGQGVILELANLDIVGARVGVIAKGVFGVDLAFVGVSGCGRGAILKAKTIIVDSSTITGSLTGLGLSASATDGTPFIRTSVITDNAGGGAKVKSAGGGNTGGTVEVSDSTISDNGKFGLFVVVGFRGDFSNNEMSRNATAGMIVRTKGDMTISDNTADDNGTYGFDMQGFDITTEAILIAAGNTATRNGVQNFLLQP